MKIRKVEGLEILDSRGFPTVEASITLEDGSFGRASVPSGASTGEKEACEKRDQDYSRFSGKGVKKAVLSIARDISEGILDQFFENQSDFDQCLIQLDGTSNKEHLGSNAILAVSLAFAHAKAASRQLSLYEYFGGQQDQWILPTPMMNVINGGAHANNQLDFQEFMVIPAGAKSFSEALQMGGAVFQCLKELLNQKGMVTSVGDEGGFAPNLSANIQALDLIMDAIERSGLKAGEDVYLALDVASSEFYKDGFYHLNSENKKLNSEQLVAFLNGWVSQYPIISIEDGMDQNDWDGWRHLTNLLGDRVQIVGDDLFVTNSQLLQKGIESKSANSILIKPNQIGSVSETIQTVNLAKKAGYSTVISHRSGETEDTTIADLAVGLKAMQIKTGSLCRTDRISKYNQLLRIEKLLESNAIYAGKKCFSSLI